MKKIIYTSSTTNGTAEQKPVEAVSDNKEKENEEIEPRRRSARLAGVVRSMAEDGIPSPEEMEKEKLEFINYKGAIKYYTDGNEIAEASDSIIQWMDQQKHLEVVPLSFDMEWPFSFQTGPGKSAVIQICVEETCCYVFQLTNLKKLPAALVALLKHPKARLHGVNIKADFRKLARDFPEVNADILVEKCVDLGTWCNQVCETGSRWSLERLCNYIMKLAIDKNKKVRMSKWHIIPLSEQQLLYAAIDVYIGLKIYQKLDEMEKQKIKNQEEFLEKNGESAYKAIKSLGETFLTENHSLNKCE